MTGDNWLALSIVGVIALTAYLLLTSGPDNGDEDDGFI